MDHKAKVGDVGAAGAVGDLGTNAPAGTEAVAPIVNTHSVSKIAAPETVNPLVTHITGKQK